LDNAFGSGSFLVAAALEQRRFIGIEKNEEVHLFKETRIDYIKVARQRLLEVEESFKNKQSPRSIFPVLRPSPKSGSPGRRGMVDVNALIAGNSQIAI
jgi:site-specific DNA-methyltransferase (adenine-specific)